MSDPIHKNYCDCSKCNFLGSHDIGSLRYDLYYCENDGVAGLFARYGSNAGDVEGMPAHAGLIPGYVRGADLDALRMARFRARIKGLLHKKAA